ncbi:MAG: helix-turn-helix transcriptional regulator [Balneolales bacterium]
MDSKVYHIKNMVCQRCVTVVQDTFSGLGFEVIQIELGKIQVKSTSAISAEDIDRNLKVHGFELLVDREDRILEEIKNTLFIYLDIVQSGEDITKMSEWVAHELGHSYSFLSKLFSDKEGITLSNYFIRLKIERVKELLTYRELTLSEIAWMLGYSSVQHLSNQFREITGQSVSEYKLAGITGRKTLDSIS